MTTITDIFGWLGQHPTISTLLGVVLCWLTISLLTLIEKPKPGSTLALLVEGVKRAGIDLPGTAKWVRLAVTHVQNALMARLLLRAGVDPSATNQGATTETTPPQEHVVNVVTVPADSPSEAPTPIPGVEVRPAIEPAVSPPPGAQS